MYKIICILIVILISSCSKDYIVFEHVGNINKPFNCIVVTRKQEPNEKICPLQTGYIANDDEFAVLRDYIRSNSKKLNLDRSNRSFGSFRININNQIYMIENSEKSIPYFRNLIKVLKSRHYNALADIFEDNVLIRLTGIQ